MCGRPNYFLACRVRDICIHNKVKEVQELATNLEPNLAKTLINPATLHVTLAVTRLETEEDVQLLSERLSNWSQQRMKLLFSRPLSLNFNGVSSFSSQVLFSEIQKNESYERLQNLSKELHDIIKLAGFETTAKFHPHLTILKLSKDRKNSKELKTKTREIFKQIADLDWNFGSELVSEIQLLSMLQKKDKTGYYHCAHEITVNS